MRTTLAIATLLLAALPSVSPAGPASLPTTLLDISPVVEYSHYPAFDANGSLLGQVPWRLINGTGNSNENYLAVTSRGRLVDLGGADLNFSDDGGQRWTSVVPTTPPFGGEGAVTGAPGGDVIAVAWDTWTADHLVSFKYDAATDTWMHSEVPNHPPFFDRPWISVIPGPFVVAGQNVPYVSILRGGWPSKDAWLYSLDGLNYLPLSVRAGDTVVGTTGDLGLKPDPATDWIQPLASSGFTPISGGGMLASEGMNLTGPLSILKPPELRWAHFRFLQQEFVSTADDAWLTDSAARLHHVAIADGRGSFFYEISTDGGGSVRSIETKLPEGFTVGEWDFKASSTHGFSVVAIHSLDSRSPNDQDLVYLFDNRSGVPRLVRLYHVGDGKGQFRGNLVSDVAEDAPRYDFANVVIFPDGRIAASFKDSQHDASTIAVMTDPIHIETLPEETPSSDPLAIDDVSPVISGFADKPDPFTPNGDRKKDVSRVKFELSEDSHVYLDVYRGEKLIRVLVDGFLPAGVHGFVWNGTNDTGRRVARGTYEYNLWSVDAAGNESDEFTLPVTRK